jgi:hypothetical protein
MAIYELAENGIVPIKETTFAAQGIRERQDLQRLLKSQIEIIAPNTLLIAEEFGEWEDSRRRVDLLGIDKDANLIVIELKRTEEGGHMELQAIRYAAMIANLTFEKVVEIHEKFLVNSGDEQDPEERILSFLDWDEVDEESFAQDVRIVLVSAEFSKEITSSVLWLNEKGLDIRCVRLRPYKDERKILLDVQTVIPLPETEQYQVQIKEKKQKEAQARTSSRDFTKYDLVIDGVIHENLNKRHSMFWTIKTAIESGISPEELVEHFPRRKNRVFKVFEGELDETELADALMVGDPGGRHPRTKRYFCKEGEFFHVSGNTYTLSNQWGASTGETIKSIISAYPQLKMRINVSDS